MAVDLLVIEPAGTRMSGRLIYLDDAVLEVDVDEAVD